MVAMRFTVLIYILCQEDSLVYLLNGLSSKQDSFFIDAKSLLSTVKELTNPICHLLHAYYCGSPTLPFVHYKLFHSVRKKTFQCKWSPQNQRGNTARPRDKVEIFLEQREVVFLLGCANKDLR
jgi:hypothetical protein